jgi:hypothetical protein
MFPVVRKKYQAAYLQRMDQIRNRLRKAGVDHAVLQTGENYTKPLMNLFKRRGK